MKKLVLFFFIFLIIPSIILAQEERQPILINQVMLEQDSGAKYEFIEFYNPNDYQVDLSDFSLKKKTSSGNESNLISAKNFQGIIKAKSYFLVSSPEFCQQIACDLEYSTSASLAKNNTILLYDPEKNISDKLGWGESQDFYEAPAINPEKNQILKRTIINIKSPNNSANFSIQKKYSEIRNSKGNIIKINLPEDSNNKESPKEKDKETVHQTNLKDIKNYKNGDSIIISGIITVLPGTLGSQYFYIHDLYKDDSNIYGVQIYNYNKLFPELKIGDRIKIIGELSITGTKPYLNYKIKTKTESDIEILSSNNIIAKPQLEKISQFQKDQIGQLKKVEGEITQNKTNLIYLDDGEKEILIEIKKNTEISSKILSEGEKFSITGLLGNKNEELKITPLNLSDIEGKTIGEISPGETLGNKNWEIKAENQTKNISKYLIISIFFLILLFVLKIVKI
ncbi:MAG TPA: lamin tail domain-containing protein [bacterium]|nr:lamin tail domain-containing protein [bacterium]